MVNNNMIVEKYLQANTFFINRVLIESKLAKLVGAKNF